MEKAYSRFVKDYNLPINIFKEDMIAYYRELYKDFWPYEEEDMMNKEILDIGSVDKWLEKYAQLRDKIIESLENSEFYTSFNSCNMNAFDIGPTVGERSYYTQETDGKCFISIDLKKANFQALKYVGVIENETYEDFIKSYGGTDYFAHSKYLRQVIFGKLNPKRQIKVEKYLLKKVEELMTLILGIVPFSFGTDEIVYSWDKEEMPTKEYLLKFKEYEDYIREKIGVDIRIEFIKIHRLPIVNSHGSTIDAYERWNVLTGEAKLKKVSTTFFPQIYKLWKGKEIEEIDRKFFFEGQIATFDKPLTLEK